jgi:hypothetical protein
VKKRHGGVDLLGLQLKKGRPPSLSAIDVPQTTTAAPGEGDRSFRKTIGTISGLRLTESPLSDPVGQAGGWLPWAAAASIIGSADHSAHHRSFG